MNTNEVRRLPEASEMHERRVIVVMGVSGAGKTTVGQLLADRLGGRFLDADDFHDHAAKSKMARGQALTDSDRAPWLDRVGHALRQSPTNTVVACSALKYEYRSRLRSWDPDIVFVHLDGSAPLIAARLSERDHEFMSPSLLDSQIITLEPLRQGERGVRVQISSTPEEIVEQIVAESVRARHALQAGG